MIIDLDFIVLKALILQKNGVSNDEIINEIQVSKRTLIYVINKFREKDLKIDTSWINEELKKPIKDDYKFLFITSVVICGTYCHIRQHWLYAPTYEMLYKMYAKEKIKNLINQ